MQTEKYLKNYIDGNLAPAASGQYLDNINPATGKIYTHFPDSNEDDLQRAIEAAERALPAWSALDPQKRFRILMRIADIIEQNSDSFARAETIDTGKPLSMSLSVDIPRAHAHFRFFASSITRFLHSRCFKSNFLGVGNLSMEVAISYKPEPTIILSPSSTVNRQPFTLAALPDAHDAKRCLWSIIEYDSVSIYRLSPFSKHGNTTL